MMNKDNYLSVIAYCFLLFLVIDVDPFPSHSAGLLVALQGNGDSLRRSIYVILLAMSLPVIYFDWQKITHVLKNNPVLLIILGWCLISPIWALAPDICARRVMGLIISTTIAITISTLPLPRLFNVLIWVTGTYMLLNFGGMAVLPNINTMDDQYWRGFHSQKNSAGSASAIATFIWLYAARQNRFFMIGCVLWLFFLIKTGSETSILLLFVLLPFAFFLNKMMIANGGRMGLLFSLLIMVFIIPLVLFMHFQFTPDLMAHVTFTNRTIIWRFVWREIALRPWFGYGYNSFWSVGSASPSLRTGDLIDIAPYTEAHNGFLDVLLSIGVVGLVLTVIFITKPLIAFFNQNYRFVSLQERSTLQCFYTLSLFFVLRSYLESDLLNGLSFEWVICLLGLLTLCSFNKRKHG
jgi:exopolysaccharide production protein ExoQ